jgi:Cu-Zn family superoxide dismutase
VEYMKRFAWVALIALLPACASLKQSSSGPVLARATLQNGSGKAFGTAEFRESSEGVLVQLHLSKVREITSRTLLPIHIHDQGKCEGPDFKSAGPHFNPEGKQHGLENPMGHHLGDLPMVKVAEGSETDAEILIQGATLTGSGKNSLLKSGGTAVVIHNGEDDQKSDPAGNAGPRMLCGVIQSP